MEAYGIDAMQRQRLDGMSRPFPSGCARVQERWFERDAEFVRATPINATAKQTRRSKVEITVNATGQQSLSPPRQPEHLGKVSYCHGEASGMLMPVTGIDGDCLAGRAGR